MRTPASRTSEPGRSPSALAKRARRLIFCEKGEMSPEALRMRKIRTPIATTTRRPTRTSLNPTLFFAGGMIQRRQREKGKRQK
jgi:hypothetical protein